MGDLLAFLDRNAISLLSILISLITLWFVHRQLQAAEEQLKAARNGISCSSLLSTYSLIAMQWRRFIEAWQNEQSGVVNRSSSDLKYEAHELLNSLELLCLTFRDGTYSNMLKQEVRSWICNQINIINDYDTLRFTVSEAKERDFEHIKWFVAEYKLNVGIVKPITDVNELADN